MNGSGKRCSLFIYLWVLLSFSGLMSFWCSTCAATDIGIFTSTKTALSWCIADKNAAYNLAREILETDVKLGLLNNDIKIRANLADRSNSPDFREILGTKLETKIIHKKQLENQIAKCVSWAKYCQQRGFNNETARTSRTQPNKTSRQSI